MRPACFWQPNDPELSRRRVYRCAQQPQTRHTAKTGSKMILNQAVGFSEWLGGPKSQHSPDTVLLRSLLDVL